MRSVAGEGVAPPVLTQFRNPQAWRGPEMAQRTDWIHRFDAGQILEIERAVDGVRQSGREPESLARADFPLPSIAPLLRSIRQEALFGRGFFLMRGLPVQRWSRPESLLAYWGLGLHLGEPVSQNAKGQLLGHVTNLGLDYADPEVRGYQTKVRLPYHADWSDLVLLLCLQDAKSGGLSSIASSTTVWNEIVRRSPRHARALTRVLCYTRWGEIPAGRSAFARVRPFNDFGGRMIASYVRAAVTKGQDLPGVPALDAETIEAMDMVDALAASGEIHLDMQFEPGDVQVLCNHSILHSRTGFEDWPERSRRRHLLRLWLACDDGPALPDFFTGELMGATASGRPDGILVPGSRPNVPVEPS